MQGTKILYFFFETKEPLVQRFPKYAPGGIRDQLAADPFIYFANG